MDEYTFVTALKKCQSDLVQSGFTPEQYSRRLALRADIGRIILEMSEHLEVAEYKHALLYCHLPQVQANEYRKIYVSLVRSRLGAKL